LRAGDLHHGLGVPQEKARRMKRALTIRNVARGAGAVVIGLIALDLVATLVTVAIGADLLKR
jgi:hypothetical protein